MMNDEKTFEVDTGGFKPRSSVILAVSLVVIAIIAIIFVQSGGFGENFSLVDIDGAPFRLRDFRSRVVLIDFMATWCGPCRLSMFDLLEIHEEFGEDLIMISIDVDPIRDTEEMLRLWREVWGADWIHALDSTNNPVSRQFKVWGLPTIVILDKKGDVVHTHLGPTGSDVLAEEISELLNK